MELAVQVSPSSTETNRSSKDPVVPAPVAMHKEPLHEVSVIEEALDGIDDDDHPDGSVPPKLGRSVASLDASNKAGLRADGSLAGGSLDERAFTTLDTVEESDWPAGIPGFELNDCEDMSMRLGLLGDTASWGENRSP